VKVFIAKDPLYRRDILVVFSTYEELLRWWKRKFPGDDTLTEDKNQAGDALTFLCRGVLGVWLPRGLSKKQLRDLLVHEAVHVTHDILDKAGMKLSDETEEAYAYHHTFIYRQIADKLNIA